MALKLLFYINRPKSDVKARMARAITDDFSSLKDDEGHGFVNYRFNSVSSLLLNKAYIPVHMGSLFPGSVQCQRVALKRHDYRNHAWVNQK